MYRVVRVVVVGGGELMVILCLGTTTVTALKIAEGGIKIEQKPFNMSKHFSVVLLFH